jgi:hypothetical protein
MLLSFVFSPDRWDSPPKGSYSIPGMWGNLFTFGGGVRGCIGFRFALIEWASALLEENTSHSQFPISPRMKALFYTLIKDLEFESFVRPEEFDNSVQYVQLYVWERLFQSFACPSFWRCIILTIPSSTIGWLRNQYSSPIPCTNSCQYTLDGLRLR